MIKDTRMGKLTVYYRTTTGNSVTLIFVIVRWDGEISVYLVNQTRKLLFWTEWLLKALHSLTCMLLILSVHRVSS